MKLEAVNIQNFRSIQMVTLEKCGSFNVIVGKNNAGKSNILIAINFFFDFLNHLTERDDFDYRIFGNSMDFNSTEFHKKLVDRPIQITMFFQVSLEEINNLIEEQANTSFEVPNSQHESDSELTLALVVETQTYSEEIEPEEFELAAFGYLKQIVLCKSGCSIVQEDNVVYTIFEVKTLRQNNFLSKSSFNLIKQICETKILYLGERREPIGEHEAKQLFNFKNKRASSERFRVLQETVTALLGVNINVFQSDETILGKGSEAELDVDGFLVQVNGAGIREALRLILDYELNRPNILLVEEPEIHLHPALETVMMSYLKSISEKCQVFITTHSTNFLDIPEMRNVYLTSREGHENSTNIQLIKREKTEEAEEAEESILRELGIRLSSVFMYDRLVFVEGKIDEAVIRKWASICDVNLVKANVKFLPMEGVRNFTHYARKRTIDFLCKRRVLVFFLLDRDERDENEIEKLFNVFKKEDRKKVIVFKKRQLENYLLCPRAIVEFIKDKYRLGEEWQKGVDLADIEEAIDRCADELKDVAIKNRVQEEVDAIIHSRLDAEHDSQISWLDRLKNKVTDQKEKLMQLENDLEKIIQAKTTLVETSWKSNKRDIVPGDKLLENLCQSLARQFTEKNKLATSGSHLKENEINEPYEWVFNKVTDSAKLASHMKKDEINSEIKEILEKFTS